MNSERTAPAQRQAHQAADNGNQELLKQGTSDQEDIGASLYVTGDRKVAVNKAESGALAERFKLGGEREKCNVKDLTGKTGIHSQRHSNHTRGEICTHYKTMFCSTLLSIFLAHSTENNVKPCGYNTKPPPQRTPVPG